MRVLGFFLSIVSGVILTAALLLWFAAGEIYDYEDTFDLARDAKSTDVVLVLAGGKRRIPMAVDVWAKMRKLRPKDQEPVLFLSGVGPTAGKETLIEQGVPREMVGELKASNVIFENVSENTQENAQLFASYVRQNKWKHVVLVTAGYHMRRAKFILEKTVDSEIEILTETVDAQHFDRNQWHKDAYAVRVTLIEYIKWLYYRYTY